MCETVTGRSRPLIGLRADAGSGSATRWPTISPKPPATA